MRPRAQAAATAASLRERLRAQLADLKMPGALEALDDILRQVDSGQLATGDALERLLGAHIALRNARRLQTAMRSARLPAVKTLADFDFSFQPSVKREQLESLHTLGFIERRENVVLLGPPGVGKTHLALSLAVATAESGRRVYFATLADLLHSLEEAQAAGRLAQRLRTLVFPSLMVIDEIGYLPITRTGAMLFFQLMARRYEQASTILTSNKGFEEWGEIFGDDVMAAALVDRLVHHCHIVNIRGNSYRLRQHADLARRLHGSSAGAALPGAELEPRRSVKSKRQEELHDR
jgi:DNA replication protein DnaC